MSKVYSYLRFSDPRQATGSSADRQAAYAARWAAEHNLMLDETLSLRDEGLSAYHQRHVKSGALGVFLAAVEDGRIAPGSVLVVEGLDRLSRAEPIQAQAQLAQIVNAGITVVTASDGKTYSRERLKANPMDLVYSLLVMIRAHEESDTKSKRVVAAIRKQCENWLAGTYKGVIRNGKDPAWVRRVGDAWELIPERVEAVRVSLDLYKRGYGATRIIDELTKQNLQMTTRGAAALQIYRLMRQRALIGEKELTLDGQAYNLSGYYPRLLTDAEWSELQMLASDRVRRKVKGSIPNVVSGIGITTCGYCGYAMNGQTMHGKPRLADGRVRDSYRRLRCVQNFRGTGCKVPGSCPLPPVETALMNYCSDMMNLQALYRGDRANAPRARLASLRTNLAKLDEQLERLTDAMLASATDGTPETFAKRARALETERAGIKAEIDVTEHELTSLARTDVEGADAKWKALAEGVIAQDYDARIQARQLVIDTFSKIVLYWRGLDPETAQKGTVDMLLIAKGGIGRMIRIDKNGKWQEGFMHGTESLPQYAG